MDRVAELRKHVRKEDLGLEIAPWVRPLVPRAEGFNCRTLDIFDRETLVRTAHERGIGYMVDQIEDVDFVGNAVFIDDTVRATAPEAKFSYIVSSHNFEHLPNPVRFLQGCSNVMADGAYLSMAMPDRRCTFEYFRPISTTADVLAAYFEQRTKPTATQIFEQISLEAHVYQDGRRSPSSLTTNPDLLFPTHRLEEAFQQWQDAHDNPTDTYVDAHCWTFTPASLALILTDLRHLGLVNFEISEIIKCPLNELFIHLRRCTAPYDNPQFYVQRKQLLRRVMAESAARVDLAWPALPGMA